MKKGIIKSFLLIAACFLLGSCVRESMGVPLSDEGQLVDYVINFGSPQGARVSVSTKGGLGAMRESNVFNLYLLIFDGNADDSKRLYGHFFDNNNLGETSLSNYWTVDNMSSDSDTPTNGTLHIKTTAKEGCTLVAVANMNPNDLDVSSGLLSTIKTFGALKDIVATQIHSEVTANSGYFMMTGQVDNVDITNASHDYSAVPAKALVLKRLYAKVTFNVQINPGSNITSFVPDKWQIINVPSCCYLLERSKVDYPTSFDAADSDVEFFPTDAEGFDPAVLTNDLLADGKTKIPSHGFTFYMMENRYSPSANPAEAWTYADREKQVAGTGSDRAFAYANPFSTYVILSGKVVMKHSTTVGETPVNATLDATVKYKIHLGNFSNSGSYDNFQTLRNHNYVYTIYINGADDIKVEADTNVENEPGATGSVVVANETVFTSDCHYSTQVISFHANYLDPEHISWYVETPFNPNGIGPNDVENDLSRVDYKWVEFRLNEKENGVYTNKRVSYKPHDYAWPEGTPTRNRTMYVDELVDYLLIQRGKYEDDPTTSDFDTDNATGGPKITFTAFVDEYYYTVHPLSGESDPSLWKDYAVNQPMRRMHILATSKRSADGESSMIGSSFTIQQRSIQSIYAVHEAADLQSAWGMEFSDDNNETGLKAYWRNKDFEDCGNTSPTNGRLNTLKLWGVLDPDWPNGPHGSGAAATLYWADFMNLHGTNETPQLWDKDDKTNPDKTVYDYNYLRYSCLTRNRDNNGNEIIDPEEIRWYMASDIQLIGVFMGAYGIEGDARLYQKTPAEQTGNDTNDWRQHIVASNRYINSNNDSNNSNKYPRVIWAEEGITGSGLQFTGAGQTSKFSTRCIRNLGYYVDPQTSQREDITLADPSIEPQPYVTATRKHLESDGTVTSPYTGTYNDNVFYEFDCSRINIASLRSRVDHELVGHDENSRMACLPSVFVAAPLSQGIDMSSYTSHSFNGTNYNLKTFKGLNDYLDASFGEMEKDFNVCPDGYRLPNIREIAIMWNIVTDYQGEGLGDSSFFGNADGNSAPSRTHWSKGPDGSNKVSDAWGWGMLSQKVLMAKPSSQHFIQKPRCVRDL